MNALPRWAPKLRKLGRYSLACFCLLDVLVIVSSRLGLRPFGIHAGFWVIIMTVGLVAITVLVAMVVAIRTLFRRKPQFQLSTLILWVLAWSVGLATFSNQLARAQKLRSIQQTMTSGRISYGFPINCGLMAEENPFGSYLDTVSLQLLGEEFVRDEWDVEVGDRESLVVASQLTRAKYFYVASAETGFILRDEDAVLIARLSNLEQLDVEQDSLTSEGLQALSRIKTLRTLHIDGSKLGNDASRVIRQFEGMKHLYLNDSPVGDEFLASVSGLPGLQSLRLEQAKISDQGLRSLIVAKAIERLQLGNNCISDAGASVFKELPRLEHLSLQNTSVSDAGMLDIARCHGLQVLDLSGTSITDKGLVLLSTLTHLVRLDVSRTNVSDGILQVPKSHPRLRQLWISSDRISPETIRTLKKSNPSLSLVVEGT